MNKRSAEIFQELVEAYIEIGDPVSSRALSKRLHDSLSSATIRNVMADLEDAGMLYSPHTSAGRIPTEQGMRFFVDALLEKSDLEDVDFSEYEKIFENKTVNEIIESASKILSGIAKCASVVIAPKLNELAIKHIEFIKIGNDKGLVIIVSEDGSVENRLITLQENISQNQLNQAANYINQYLYGKTLNESYSSLVEDLEDQKNQLDQLTAKFVKQGLAFWAGETCEHALIVKGQSNLLENIQQLEDVDRIKSIFQKLDEKENVTQLIDAAVNGEGIKLYIGSEHSLFMESGCSMIVSPYCNQKNTVIGAIGVIGPVHMNYRRIIPLVDYTAKIISKIIQSS